MIKVFTKDNCPYCVTAKNYLESLQIQFEEVNVENDNEARSFLKEHGHRSVPQIYVNESDYIQGGCNGLLSMKKEDLDILIGGNAC